MDFDVIGKMETFDDDAKFVLEQKNLSHILPPKMPRLNQSAAKTKKHGGLSRQKRHNIYLNQLSADQKERLWNVYGRDIVMFDYQDSLHYLVGNDAKDVYSL